MLDRFGWTLEQLDEQDEPRAIEYVSVLNITDGYSRVIQGVMGHRMESISQGDWKIYRMVKEGIEDGD